MENKKEKSPGRAKRALLVIIRIIFVALCALSAVYGVTGVAEHELRKNALVAEPSAQNGVFYPIDDGADIFTEKDFLSKNLYISYTDETGAVTHIITEDRFGNYGEDVAFFARYFEAVRHGEYEKYDEFFTNSYFRTHEHMDLSFGFTMQRIYDVHISYASSYTQGGAKYTTYEVTYKIMKNDGTFRRDIASDEYRPQYVTLAHGADGVHIVSIAYSYDPTFDYSLSAVKTEIIAAAAGAALLIAYAVFRIVKKKRRKAKNG